MLEYVQQLISLKWPTPSGLDRTQLSKMDNATVMRNVMNLIPPPPPPKSDYSDTVVVRTLPLIGRVHLVNDTNGILQLAFVFAYWVYGTFSTLYIILLPQYDDGNIPLSIVISFMVVSIMCLLALIKASITNPGRIPLLSNDTSIDTSTWNFCRSCNRKRPPRAHHCRRCQQCVLRMDHHCPWINNCVGEENQFAFFLLLLYAFLLSAYALTLSIFHFWMWPKCVACDKESFYIHHSIWFIYLLVVLAFNMSVVMALQLATQHCNLLSDRTTLDNLQGLPFQTGSHLRVWYSSYRELCGRSPVFCWLWPCRRRRPLFTHPNRAPV